jgi:hypothetical protein
MDASALALAQLCCVGIVGIPESSSLFPEP